MQNLEKSAFIVIKVKKNAKKIAGEFFWTRG